MKVQAVSARRISVPDLNSEDLVSGLAVVIVLEIKTTQHELN